MIHEKEVKKMFLIRFKYKNGKGGYCEEFGKKISFETEEEATTYAKRLNDIVAPNENGFFPEWFPVEVKGEV